MSLIVLKQRVAFLEQELAEIKRVLTNGAQDWRSTIGIFAGDEIMKQIDEESRKIREADRKRARRLATTSRRHKK